MRDTDAESILAIGNAQDSLNTHPLACRQWGAKTGSGGAIDGRRSRYPSADTAHHLGNPRAPSATVTALTG